MKLFEISARYQKLLDKEEITHEDEIELTGLMGNIEDGCINLAASIRNLQAESSAVLEAMNNMDVRLVSLELNIARKRKLLLDLMKNNQLERITNCPHFVIKIRKGREKVDTYDKEKIPLAYYKQKTTDVLSLEWITEDIKKGIEVPGARIIRKDKIEIK